MSSCDKLTEQMSPISLAIWAQHQTTAATEFVCFLPLCHSHWGARQGGELNSLCSFCPVFCKASDICPSSRQPQGSSRKRYVVIRSKGQDGILWMCQYVVNMETDFTSKTGMACPAHVQCWSSYSAEWELRLLLHSCHKDSFESMLEMQCTDKLASISLP